MSLSKYRPVIKKMNVTFIKPSGPVSAFGIFFLHLFSLFSSVLAFVRMIYISFCGFFFYFNWNSYRKDYINIYGKTSLFRIFLEGVKNIHIGISFSFKASISQKKKKTDSSSEALQWKCYSAVFFVASGSEQLHWFNHEFCSLSKRAWRWCHDICL